MMPLLLPQQEEKTTRNTHKAFMLRERTGNSPWPKDSLRIRKRMTLVKDIPWEPYPHSSTHHLYILLDPLLIVTLGQNHNPTLYLVAKDNQSGVFLCFLVMAQRTGSSKRTGRSKFTLEGNPEMPKS